MVTIQLRNNKASKIRNQLFTDSVWTLGTVLFNSLRKRKWIRYSLQPYSTNNNNKLGTAVDA